MNAPKRIIQKLLRAAGLEVRAYNCATSPTLRLQRQLAHHGIGLVLDVGANDGGFGRSLYGSGYRGQLLSFEPQAAEHERLCRHAARQPGWDVAPRVAAGAHADQLTLHVAGNSLSSSLLPMLEAHRAAAPDSAYVRTEEVPVQRLDVLVPRERVARQPTLLKIDTQGYEGPVLDGAADLLPLLRGVYLELSLEPVYAGQQLFDALHARLLALGFACWGLSASFCDERTGRVLQLDGAYFRPFKT